MRAKSFLIEGGLTPRDFYERYRLDNLIKKLDTGGEFITITGDKIVVPASPAEIKYLKGQLKTAFDSVEPKARANPSLKIPAEIGGVKLSKLQKTKDFGGTVGVAATGEMDYSKANLGPTVEALKSFAIYAKLTMRGKESITAEDVLKIAKMAAENSKEEAVGNASTPTTLAVYSRNVPDENKSVKDQITLKVALSSPSFQRAVRTTAKDKSAWGNLQGIVSYVNNESDIGKYSRYFTKNNKRDPLKISVVGIGGAKTDIASTYVDPKTGVEKPLTHLSLSVKSAGAEWYDQAPGGNEDGMRKFYGIIGLGSDAANEAMEEAKFKGGDKKSTTPEIFRERVKAVNRIYEIAYRQLKARIPKLSDKGEADYIHDFIGRLRSSLAGDERLVYVKFDANGTYNKLNPQTLSHLAKYLDLDVNISLEGTRPRIFWIDRKTGKTLLYVVLLVNEPNYRLTHQFNLGKDFFDLLKIASEYMQKGNDTTASAPAPATTPSAPAVGQPAIAPSTPTVQGPGKSITTLAPGMAMSPNPYTLQQPEEEPVTETGNDRDLDYIKRMSGILDQMSKHS